MEHETTMGHLTPVTVLEKYLDVQLKEARTELDSVRQELARTQFSLQNLGGQRDAVSEAVQDLIDSGVITDKESIKVLASNLDLSVTRTIAFTITAEITGEVELEWGESLDDYGFSIDGLSYNGSYVNEWSEGHFDVEWEDED